MIDVYKRQPPFPVSLLPCREIRRHREDGRTSFELAVIASPPFAAQVDFSAKEALFLSLIHILVSQMDEMKKRKPSPLKTPVHKQITPVLIRRKTTD